VSAGRLPDASKAGPATVGGAGVTGPGFTGAEVMGAWSTGAGYVTAGGLSGGQTATGGCSCPGGQIVGGVTGAGRGVGCELTPPVTQTCLIRKLLSNKDFSCKPNWGRSISGQLSRSSTGPTPARFC
jgi:hypothetical protein